MPMLRHIRMIGLSFQLKPDLSISISFCDYVLRMQVQIFVVKIARKNNENVKDCSGMMRRKKT
jgi:hypothetical protein